MKINALWWPTRAESGFSEVSFRYCLVLISHSGSLVRVPVDADRDHQRLTMLKQVRGCRSCPWWYVRHCPVLISFRALSCSYRDPQVLADLAGGLLPNQLTLVFCSLPVGPFESQRHATIDFVSLLPLLIPPTDRVNHCSLLLFLYLFPVVLFVPRVSLKDPCVEITAP